MVKQNDIAQNTQLQKEEIETLINNLDNWILDTKKLAEVLRHMLSKLPDDSLKTTSKSTENKSIIVNDVQQDLQQTLTGIQEKTEDEKKEIYTKLNNSTDVFVLNEIKTEKDGNWRAELLQYFLKNKMKRDCVIQYVTKTDFPNTYKFLWAHWVSFKFYIDENNYIGIQKYQSEEVVRSKEISTNTLYSLFLIDNILGTCYEIWNPENPNKPFFLLDKNKIHFKTKANSILKVFMSDDKKYDRKWQLWINPEVAIDLLNNLRKQQQSISKSNYDQEKDFLIIPKSESVTQHLV
jgi:hypothetical protein